MLIECTKDQIKCMRTKNKFNDLYEQVINSADDCEISVPIEKKKRNNISSKLTDFFVTNSVGQNQMDGISEYKMKMKIQYFEIIDNILIEIDRRFKQTDLIEAVEACNPNSKKFLDLNTFFKLPGISTKPFS